MLCVPGVDKLLALHLNWYGTFEVHTHKERKRILIFSFYLDHPLVLRIGRSNLAMLVFQSPLKAYFLCFIITTTREPGALELGITIFIQMR